MVISVDISITKAIAISIAIDIAIASAISIIISRCTVTSSPYNLKGSSYYDDNTGASALSICVSSCIDSFPSTCAVQ